MIPAFASSLAAIGSIRKTAGLRKLRGLLAEMDIRAMLSAGWISWFRMQWQTKFCDDKGTGMLEHDRVANQDGGGGNEGMLG